MYIKKYPQKEDIKMFLSKLKFLEDTETLPPIGEEWWNKIEKDLAEVGAKVVYFPYTKGTSSTLINETLIRLREENK